MPAIVRVKRRVDEEPLSAFVLNGKKRRLEDGSAAAVEADESILGAIGGVKDDISTILKFAGTIEAQDDNATTQFARLTKDKAKDLVQQKARRSTNATDRARQNVRQSAQENRFKIVNCMRTAFESTNETAKGKGELTIVDIEKQHTISNDNAKELIKTTRHLNDIGAATSSSIPAATPTELIQPSDSDTGYVYDLYLPENEQQAEYVDMMDDNYLSVRPFDDLFYEDCFNDDDDENDSEDSNEENHFGNDYPDEDIDLECSDNSDSGGERELCDAIENFVFGDDDDEDQEGSDYEDLSDDDDDDPYHDPYVHTVDVDDEENFAYGFDPGDVERYGIAYARYKKRILKKLNPGLSDDSDDDKDDNVGEVSDEDHYHSARDYD